MTSFCRSKEGYSVQDPASAQYRYGGVGRWMHPPESSDGILKDKDGDSIDATPNGNVLGTYNTVFHHIPIVNLLFSFFGSSTSGSTWQQLAILLENISIVSALILALVITFQSAYDFDEITANDARFALSGEEYRVVNKLEYSSAYAEWWGRGNGGQNGGGRRGDCDDINSPDCTGQKNRVSEVFHSTCLLSEAFLTLSLILSVIVLSTGGITSIGRPSADTSSYHYRVVMESYMKYIRVIVVVTLVATVIGLVLFFQLIKYEVFLKVPDIWVELNRNSMNFPAQPFTAFYGTIYGFSHSAVVYYCYLPLFIFAWILSAGQRAVYSFPIQPLTDFLEPPHERHFSRAALVDFLVKTCRLSHCGGTGFVENEKIREFIFLSTAGGNRSNEAEVIADHLYDIGIRTVQELILFVKTGDDEIFNVNGISIMAASQIVWSINADLDEVWYEQPKQLYCFRPGKSNKGALENYNKLINSNPNSPEFRDVTETVYPIVNKIDPAEREIRQRAAALANGANADDDSFAADVSNETVQIGTQLAWNGYLLEFVPAAGNLVVPPSLDSNIRIEPFSNYQWKSFGGKKGNINAKSENSLWHAKLKKAYTDWGIYIMDRGASNRKPSVVSPQYSGMSI